MTKQCSVGREGRLCASCQPGYFLLSDKCMTCRKPETLFVVGTVICIILFWYLINRYVCPCGQPFWGDIYCCCTATAAVAWLPRQLPCCAAVAYSTLALKHILATAPWGHG